MGLAGGATVLRRQGESRSSRTAPARYQWRVARRSVAPPMPTPVAGRNGRSIPILRWASISRNWRSSSAAPTSSFVRALNVAVTAKCLPVIRTRLAGNGMALTNFGIARGSPRCGACGRRRTWPSGALAAILPFVLILAVVRRGPPAVLRDRQWRRVLLFSVARDGCMVDFPMSPRSTSSRPGFSHLAVVQAIFGASYATIKGMEIVAVAAGASLLFVMLRPFGSVRLAHLDRGALSGLHPRFRRHGRRQHALAIAFRDRPLRRGLRGVQATTPIAPAVVRRVPRRACDRCGRHDQADGRV